MKNKKFKDFQMIKFKILKNKILRLNNLYQK